MLIDFNGWLFGSHVLFLLHFSFDDEDGHKNHKHQGNDKNTPKAFWVGFKGSGHSTPFLNRCEDMGIYDF
ncbi:MAG TPA: hypothetical protein DIW47_11575 [Bacteroidetes bacterium]|nr:hypothetical protein [Bacteroidota bacterium]